MATNSFTILDYVSNGCCVIGEGGKIVFWNKTLELWTDLTQTELVDQNLFEVFPNLAQPRFRDRIMGVLETGAPTFFSSALNPEFFPSHRAGGRPRIQQSALNRLALDSNTPLVLITVSDVTDQHERGEKYRMARAQVLEESRIRGEREAQFRLVVGLSSAAILICDTDGNIQDCNPAALRIFNTPELELIGTSLQRLFLPHHSNAIQQRLSAETSTGDPGAEFEGLRRNGTHFPAELTVRLLETNGKRQYVAYIYDLTNRKRAEEALHYAQKQESLGALAGGIAHDFNNLFGGVLGILDLVESKQNLEDPQRAQLERIRGEIVRAAELSRKMLAFSGKGRFSMTSLSINHLIQDYWAEMSQGIPRNIQLRSRLSEGLPAIEADPPQIRQLIQYLVTNSVEAITSEGTIDIITGVQDLDPETLRHACPGQPLSPGKHVTIEVVDTGCGINAENLSRIFDPFFSTKFAGRGLSLAVGQGILRGHRAGFAISSAVGIGTRFKLFFPAVTTTSTINPPSEPHHQVRVGKILVVDDEPVLRETVRELLEAMGHDVDTASDGQEAVELYQQRLGAYALVIMDLTMPRMDGLEAFHRIHALDPEAHIILSSGFSEHDAILRFHDMGISAFLPKPYRLTQLENAIAPFVKLPD